MSVKNTNIQNRSQSGTGVSDFVLEKSIFSKVFEKDIKRVYIYKKSERLAKAVHLICPAFANHPALKDKIDAIAIGLIEAAILPPSLAREALSRELLALSSVLAIARSGGALSSMNVEIITQEAHILLQEIAGYEEPNVSFEETPTLPTLMRRTIDMPKATRLPRQEDVSSGAPTDKGQNIKDKVGRKEAILSVIRSKGPSYIKDISTVLRDVGEKTIQRELQALTNAGLVRKEGDRRWTRYSLI